MKLNRKGYNLKFVESVVTGYLPFYSSHIDAYLQQKQCEASNVLGYGDYQLLDIKEQQSKFKAEDDHIQEQDDQDLIDAVLYGELSDVELVLARGFSEEIINRIVIIDDIDEEEDLDVDEDSHDDEYTLLDAAIVNSKSEVANLLILHGAKKISDVILQRDENQSILEQLYIPRYLKKI